MHAMLQQWTIFIASASVYVCAQAKTAVANGIYTQNMFNATMCGDAVLLFVLSISFVFILFLHSTLSDGCQIIRINAKVYNVQLNRVLFCE